MAQVQEERDAVVPTEDENDINKAVVTKRSEVPPVPAEFETGDTVKLSVLENGVRTSKKMEVIEVVPVAGKWRYKVRRPGDAGTYRDRNGIDKFPESALAFW